jgi:hypothetical protein
MFANEIRRAVEAAPRLRLPEIRSLLYKALTAGQVSEVEADELDDLITTKAALPAPEKPARRRVGARPRSPASMERRRSWAAKGLLPAHLAARFTLGEQAVLAVIAAVVKREGACTWSNGKVAAVAGVCLSTVKNTLRQARMLGQIHVEERRRTPRYNDTNRVTILPGPWRAFLALDARDRGGQRRQRGVVKTVATTSLLSIEKGRRSRNRSRQQPPERGKGAAGIAGDGSGEGGAR